MFWFNVVEKGEVAWTRFPERKRNSLENHHVNTMDISQGPYSSPQAISTNSKTQRQYRDNIEKGVETHLPNPNIYF